MKWANDSDFQLCSSCKANFTIFNRKHHCRVCGLIFCHACSSSFLNIDNNADDPPKLSRCCQKCAATLISDTNTENQQSIYVNTNEYTAGEPYKLYGVTIPSDWKVGQTMRVSLDNRIFSITIPRTARPGDRITVKAPLPIQEAIAEVTDQYALLDDYVTYERIRSTVLTSSHIAANNNSNNNDSANAPTTSTIPVNYDPFADTNEDNNGGITQEECKDERSEINTRIYTTEEHKTDGTKSSSTSNNSNSDRYVVIDVNVSTRLETVCTKLTDD